MKKIILLITLIPFILFAQKKDFKFIQKIIASDRSVDTVNSRKGDWFGWDVAVSGKTIVVSARNKPLNTNKSAGKVYLFELNKYGKWVEKQTFTSNKKENNDYFGSKVAINSESLIIASDGEGLYHKNSKTKDIRGGVYFYNKNNNWQLINHIMPEKYGRFGYDIALHNDLLAVSDYNNNNVIVYKKTYNNWHPTDTITKNIFFFSMGISLSDKFIVTNVPNTKTNKNIFDVYSLDDEGKASFLQQINPPNKNYSFGMNVYLHKNSLLIGNAVEEKNKGQVFLYELNNNGSWVFKEAFESKLDIIGDFFGSDFCMNDKYLVIGAVGNDIDNQGKLKEIEGAVYIYKKINNKWVFHQKLKAVNPTVWDKYGFSVDISDNYLVVGSRFDKEDANEKNPIDAAGSAYIYKIKE